jgi:hypothetical protein
MSAGMVALPAADVPLQIFEARYRVLFNTLLDGEEGCVLPPIRTRLRALHYACLSVRCLAEAKLKANEESENPIAGAPSKGRADFHTVTYSCCEVVLIMSSYAWAGIT